MRGRPWIGVRANRAQTRAANDGHTMLLVLFVSVVFAALDTAVLLPPRLPRPHPQPLLLTPPPPPLLFLPQLCSQWCFESCRYVLRVVSFKPLTISRQHLGGSSSYQIAHEGQDKILFAPLVVGFTFRPSLTRCFVSCFVVQTYRNNTSVSSCHFFFSDSCGTYKLLSTFASISSWQFFCSDI